MKKIASLEVYNRKLYINAVLSFIDSIVTNHVAHDFDRYNRMRFSVGEILKKRIENAYPDSEGKICVELFLSDEYFEISIKDKGVPSWSDFSYDKSKLSGGNEDLKNYILDMWIDSVGMEKLGKDGQRIYLRQKILNPLGFIPPEPYSKTEVLDTNITIKPVQTEADAIEAIRCIYSEYGYSYSYERLYYVDSFMKLIKSGELISFLAVNDHGQTAGHFALASSSLYKGMPEISTVVIRSEFRGLGLFSLFMNHCIDYAKNNGIRALMGQPVAFHPMSQKAFIKAGFTATSLLLSYLGSDIESEYNKDGQRLDLCSAVKIIDSDASSCICPPDELKEFVSGIYDKLGMKYEFGASSGFSGDTEITVEDNSALMIKKIILRSAGNDLHKILSDAVTDAIRKKTEMIELMISMRSSCCSAGYEVAGKCGFAFSGIMPGAENDDYIIMQLLIKNERKYDHLVTVGEFEELKNNIMELAPCRKENIEI